jgi:DNA-directed RNA polymerase specialized sigma24 family protein
MTFDEFVHARLPALLRFAAVLAGDRELAQDVVQDALVIAHGRWSRIDAPGTVRSAHAPALAALRLETAGLEAMQ